MGVASRKLTIGETRSGLVGNLYSQEGDNGPGLLLLSDTETKAESLIARAALFAEEGYTVLTLSEALSTEVVRTAVACLMAQPETNCGPVCVAHGNVAQMALTAADSFLAMVLFDASGLVNDTESVARAPCPVVLQFGTDVSDAVAIADALSPHINRTNGSRVYTWPDAQPGFALPGHPAFDRRIDSLAHTRTLELIRRVVGPYYDYEALFAEHIRHEFETRDVDATMGTMINDPYVNHVATLAGGVGHDMLKRFYKYHFVDQNSRERVSTTVSMTPGPDRVVLELVVRFRHDATLDRYFPGIAPTGKVVELATLLVVKFRGDKVCHEHIYWDQGSALKQIGVLETGDLPVAGPEAARKVLDEHLPSNIFMQDAWASSDGKPV